MSHKRLSVVVSNYNYGHFLEACLTSLTSQTCPADEIIVVDDGSTDSSANVLNAWQTKVRVIRQPNQGQAAAMQTGFEASTGEVILFFDADDLLKPTAVETLHLVWNPQFAAVSFGLDLIDADGRTLGVYDERPASGDLRPLLLADAGFPFMPTSGNLFRRDVVQTLFPLPRRRWKISADAALIRAAAWLGEVRVIPDVLGCYRTHAANNYYRESAASIWLSRRGLRDMADLARLFSERVGNGGLGAIDPAAARELRLTEIRARAIAAARHDGNANVRRAVLSAIAEEARHPLAKGMIRRCTFLAALLASPPRREEVLFRPHRPRWLDLGGRMVLGHAIDEERRETKRPRFLPPARLSTNLLGTWGILSTHDWRQVSPHEGAWMCGGEGAIYLRPPVNQAPLRLQLALAPAEGWSDCPMDVHLVDEGEIHSTARMAGPVGLDHLIAPERTYRDTVIELRLRVMPVRSTWRNLGKPGSLVVLKSLTLEPTSPECTGAILISSTPTAFAEIARACVRDGKLTFLTNGGVQIAGEVIGLRFRLGEARGSLLHLTFGDNQPVGWLFAKSGGRLLYDGEIGPGSAIVLELDATAHAYEATDLEFSFAPQDEFGDDHIVIGAILHVPVERARDHATGERESGTRPPCLSPGQQVDPTEDSAARRVFSVGWRFDPLDGAILDDTTGMIEFARPAGAAETMELRLHLAPRIPLAEDDNLIVSVGQEGKLLARVNLRGDHVLEVLVRAGSTDDAASTRILVHVAGFVGDEPPEPRSGALAVALISLAREETRVLAPRIAAPARQVPSFHAEIRRAAALARSIAEEGADCDRMKALVGRHAEIVKSFQHLSGRALAPTLAHPGTMAALAAIGRASRLAGAEAAAPTSNASEWREEGGLRSFVLAMLCGHASHWAGAGSLTALPPFVRGFPDAVSSWLTEPPPRGEADAPAFRAHALALLHSCRDLFQRERPGSGWFMLAESVFRTLNIDMFAKGDNCRELALAKGNARRTLLQAQGSMVAWAPVAYPGTKPSLALLIGGPDPARNESDVARLLAGLDRSRIRTTAYYMGGCTESAIKSCSDQTIVLAGHSPSACVGVIRAGAHDMMLLAGFGDEIFEDMAAHRLAALQVASTAFWPRTTGLASVDIMLSDLESDASQFVERLVRLKSGRLSFASWLMAQLGVVEGDGEIAAVPAMRSTGAP
ncbi:MAG: glycosyltransferase [Rhizobiaceae bacterium]|nr:glycosyltransferase [Rhizobiaceae bacterium]MCV0405287.1 glycosyltransferase [Rhizobiaceae bacterium]